MERALQLLTAERATEPAHWFHLPLQLRCRPGTLPLSPSEN